MGSSSFFYFGHYFAVFYSDLKVEKSLLDGGLLCSLPNIRLEKRQKSISAHLNLLESKNQNIRLLPITKQTHKGYHRLFSVFFSSISTSVSYYFHLSFVPKYIICVGWDDKLKLDVSVSTMGY